MGRFEPLVALSGEWMEKAAQEAGDDYWEHASDEVGMVDEQENGSWNADPTPKPAVPAPEPAPAPALHKDPLEAHRPEMSPSGIPFWRSNKYDMARNGANAARSTPQSPPPQQPGQNDDNFEDDEAAIASASGYSGGQVPQQPTTQQQSQAPYPSLQGYADMNAGSVMSDDFSAPGQDMPVAPSQNAFPYAENAYPRPGQRLHGYSDPNEEDNEPLQEDPNYLKPYLAPGRRPDPTQEQIDRYYPGGFVSNGYKSTPFQQNRTGPGFGGLSRSDPSIKTLRGPGGVRRIGQ